MNLTYSSYNFNPSFPFAIYPYTAREVSKEDSFHWHSFCEVTLVRRGQGSYFANGEEYQMAPGDLVIFNNAEPHGWVKFKEDMELLVMIFRPDFVLDGMGSLGREYMQPFKERGSNFRNQISHQDPQAGAIAGIMNNLIRENEHQQEGWQMMIYAEVLQILALLFRYYQKEQPADQTLQEKTRELARLESAIDYIEAHYKDKLTLDEVAQVCYMSPAYFSSYFKKATNMNFTEYVNQLRVREAKRLIDTGDDSVTDIAVSCGFNNMSNFYKIYNKYYSEPPRQKR